MEMLLRYIQIFVIKITQAASTGKNEFMAIDSSNIIKINQDHQSRPIDMIEKEIRIQYRNKEK